MEIAGKRRLGDRVLGLFLLSHPLPVLLHVVAVSVFALLAAWPLFPWEAIALVIGAHAAMQVSIAMINDYCDRELDTASKPEKPLVRGLVTPKEALIAGVVMMVVMLLLLLPLNRLALLLSLCYLALAQAYNLGLKSTPLSGLIFALAMPLIPAYAFAGLGRVLPIIFWLIPAGFLLGITLNLANSLRDLEEDAAQGARTLAVVLGVQGSFAVSELCFLLSMVLIAVLTLTRLIPAQSLIVGATLLLNTVALIVCLLFFGPKHPAETRTHYFYLIALTSIVLAGGWLVGVLI
ncbi:MAG TPA: UbiA family prenyltransferase [Ktedonobacteraceae bacterium]|nr:UbiA family prenyltransferase [Ktedonobacteraceae bacterium]